MELGHAYSVLVVLFMRYADSNGFSAVLIPPYPSSFLPPDNTLHTPGRKRTRNFARM